MLESRVHDFTELVETYRSTACSIASRFLYDSNDIEDVVQEAFILIYQKFNRPDFFRSKVTPVLRSIIRNLCLSRNATLLSRRRFLAFDSIDHLNVPAPSDPEKDVLRMNVRDIVLKILESLNPRHVDYFLRRVIDREPTESIAISHNVGSSGVCSGINRTTDHVRVLMERYRDLL